MGGRSKCVLPQKILKFQGPKNAIFIVLGTNFENKRVFFIQENVAFNLLVTQSIPPSNERMMKTKLRTFAHKQILHKPERTFEKMTEI